MAHQDRLNIAVFIDFDNIEIGVKTTLGQQFDVGIILDAIKERGEVVTKIAYADWTRSGEYSRSLTQHAIRLVQRNMTPGGDKNGADINLALDALEMAFTHSHINAYVIVGGDSDFLSLVEKLKQYDKKVFVVGGRAFTSMILQRNCHEFIAYENLAGVRKAAAKQGARCRPRPRARRSRRRCRSCAARSRFSRTARSRRRPACSRARCCSSTPPSPNATTAPRRSSTSSRSWRKSGYVHLKTSGRSVMVELNEGFVDEPRAASEGDEQTRRRCERRDAAGPQAAQSGLQWSRRLRKATRVEAPRARAGGGFNPASQEPVGPPLGDQADGVQKADASSAPRPARAGRCTCATSNRFCGRPRVASTSGATASAG